ncbi:helix-turn-helix transcriptional regulator [Zhongshania guokunii]|uniref:Helix-turn-helix transcriptional regulator n=1 Tax=Zhongshania guokunii TaxID=641783 RepID=A0ABV3U926_9GAMM
MSQSNRTNLLRLPQVISRTGLARSTIYDLIQSSDFPAPIPLAGRTVAWVESSIDKWIDDRITAAQHGGGE